MMGFLRRPPVVAIIVAGGASSALDAPPDLLAGGFRVAFAAGAATFFLAAILSRFVPARVAPPPDSAPPIRLRRGDFNQGWPAGRPAKKGKRA